MHGEPWGPQLTELLSVQESLDSMQDLLLKDETLHQYYVVPCNTQNTPEIAAESTS